MSVQLETDKIAAALVDAIDALKVGDLSKLASRIRSISHSTSCSCSGVTIRLNYPTLRDGKATVFDLVTVITTYLVWFALPRSARTKVFADHDHLAPDDFALEVAKLVDEARSLFIRAQENTKRTGEAGELLLYLLTEWILQAPQLLAKMSLKTNPQTPVYGCDGIHIKFDSSSQKLLLYWGEAKLHADLGSAIKSAIDSISTALEEAKIGHELLLVQQHIDLSGLSEQSKTAILSYLDPYDDHSNARENISTCLVGFNFEKYGGLSGVAKDKIELEFEKLARSKLDEISIKFADVLTSKNLQHHTIELFVFPLPSVEEFRKEFQNKIGWKSD